MSAGLEEARRLLESADLDDRCRGVERLAAVDSAESTERLAALLEESSWYLRERVVEALGERGGATAAIAKVP